MNSIALEMTHKAIFLCLWKCDWFKRSRLWEKETKTRRQVEDVNKVFRLANVMEVGLCCSCALQCPKREGGVVSRYERSSEEDVGNEVKGDRKSKKGEEEKNGNREAMTKEFESREQLEGMNASAHRIPAPFRAWE
ncbi:Protein of unknown function [Gryllus bimaculatus]|nr:Protein of unknown function [Gryllus bimaculatus]